MNSKILKMVIFFSFFTAMSGTCTGNNIKGPVETINSKPYVDELSRLSHGFNKNVDTILLKPVSKKYMAYVPGYIRKGVSNVFDNFTYPNTALNDFLQGKIKNGFNDLGRIFINSTLGIAGVFDVAGKMGLQKNEEDFGQTLSVWGVGQGEYIEYPILGPNSLRSTPGIAVEAVTDAGFWIVAVVAPQIAIPLYFVKMVNARANMLKNTNAIEEMSIDEYKTYKSVWLQHRNYLIKDGNDDDWSDDLPD